MLTRLDDKIALITGAGAGMGRAHATRMHAEGAYTYVADIDVAAAQATADTLVDHVEVLELDVRSETSWAAAAQMLAARHGRLDILVNNAGILVNEPLETTSKTTWDAVMAVNLTGPFLGIRAMAPLLRASRGASVVNVSSPAGLQGRAGMAAYSASKFGIRGLTQSAALELAEDGIRVNVIHPGTVRTGMLGDHDETSLAARIPLGRIGEPRDIAALVVFLCSEEATYITGSEFVIDGGRHAGPSRQPARPRDRPAGLT